MSAECRELFGKDGVVSALVRRGRLIVGTCSTRSDNCRYMFDEVGLVS